MDQTPPFAEFADLITQLKEERNVTQSDIARALEVAPSQPSGWASGRSRPKPENLERMAEVYGLDVDELFRMCRYRTRATENDADPLEAEVIALLRQVPDNHRDALKVLIRGLAVQPMRPRPNRKARPESNHDRAAQAEIERKHSKKGDSGSDRAVPPCSPRAGLLGHLGLGRLSLAS